MPNLAVIGHPRFQYADLSRIRGILNVGVPERLRSMFVMITDT